MKKLTNISKRKKPKKKQKLNYSQKKYEGMIKSRITEYKGKIWPNQAIQDL